MHDIAFGIVFVLLFVLLIVLFCAVLIKIYIQKIKKYNHILLEKERNHQKEINQTILETQEHTLQNIAQELHDDAGQQLTYINFQLENLKLDYKNIESEIVPVSESLSHLSKTIRSLSHSLSNQILSQQNVIKAIETEVIRMNSNLPITLEVINKMKTFPSFPTNEKIVIYRIFQEAINNALKHANANTITITLENEPNFKMTISDNGNGFDIKNNHNMATNGLNNLKSRAQLVNYHLAILSEINKGTTIQLLQN